MSIEDNESGITMFIMKLSSISSVSSCEIKNSFKNKKIALPW